MAAEASVRPQRERVALQPHEDPTGGINLGRTAGRGVVVAARFGHSHSFPQAIEAARELWGRVPLLEARRSIRRQ